MPSHTGYCTTDEGDDRASDERRQRPHGVRVWATGQHRLRDRPPRLRLHRHLGLPREQRICGCRQHRLQSTCQSICIQSTQLGGACVPWRVRFSAV